MGRQNLPVLLLVIQLLVITLEGQSFKTITRPPVQTPLLLNRNNPLSELISEGIVIGNSILGGILSSPTTTTSTKTPSQSTHHTSATETSSDGGNSSSKSSHPHSKSKTSSDVAHSSSTSSRQHSKTKTSSTTSRTDIRAHQIKSSTSTSSTPTTTSFSLPSSSLTTHNDARSRPQPHTQTKSSTNQYKIITIVLAAVLGVVLLAFTCFLLWFCFRRYKRRQQSSMYDSVVPSPVRGQTPQPTLPEVEENRNFRNSDQSTTGLLPQPPEPMPNPFRARAKERFPDLTNSAMFGRDNASSSTPFLASGGMTEHSIDESSTNGTSHHPSQSSEMDATPISPVESHTPTSTIAELDNSNAPWVPRKSSRRQFIKPSRRNTDSDFSKFDFGFGRQTPPGKKAGGGAAYKIQRRPVPGGR